MIFKRIRYILCIVLFATTSPVTADAQVGRAVRSVVDGASTTIGKWFGKRAAKEAAEEGAEQGMKSISKEIAQRTISKNRANAISDPAITISHKSLQETAPANIKKTLALKVGREVNENALKSASKEFAQQIGKTSSKEARDISAKRLGTESSQKSWEESANKTFKSKAFDTEKSGYERVVDKYNQLRLKLSGKIRKSKIYREVQDIHNKGAIELSEKEKTVLRVDPKNNFKGVVKGKIGTKPKSVQSKIEFFIRLKDSDPQYTQELLSNPEIKEHMEKSLRGQGGMHEWLMVRNFLDFLFNPKWGDAGDVLAMALPRLVQRTDNVIFKAGGKHGGLNSTRFHNGLSKVIDNSNNIEELYINMKRYAKQNLTVESYNEFLKILEETFAA
ncbi:MAG: hypothetical protein IJX65_05400 [Alistipes sp.]|nr:hypothetical protein [Alistipes sp.]